MARIAATGEFENVSASTTTTKPTAIAQASEICPSPAQTHTRAQWNCYRRVPSLCFKTRLRRRGRAVQHRTCGGTSIVDVHERATEEFVFGRPPWPVDLRTTDRAHHREQQMMVISLPLSDFLALWSSHCQVKKSAPWGRFRRSLLPKFAVFLWHVAADDSPLR